MRKVLTYSYDQWGDYGFDPIEHDESVRKVVSEEVYYKLVNFKYWAWYEVTITPVSCTDLSDADIKLPEKYTCSEAYLIEVKDKDGRILDGEYVIEVDQE